MGGARQTIENVAGGARQKNVVGGARQTIKNVVGSARQKNAVGGARQIKSFVPINEVRVKVSM